MHINMYKSSQLCINVRLWVYFLATIHSVIIAYLLCSIDFSHDENPKVRSYVNIRWKLITTWSNVILSVYLPVSLYCDWREKIGERNVRHVRIIRELKENIFCSVLFPTIFYSDIFFWRVFTKDPSLVGPLEMLRYVPLWLQHSLHTVSAVVCLLDVSLVPRQRPKSLVPGLIWTISYCSLYIIVAAHSSYCGTAVYPALDQFSLFQYFLVVLHFYLELVFYYTVLWHLVDLIWSKDSRIQLYAKNVFMKLK